MADDDLLVGKAKEVLRKHFAGASDYDLRIEAVRIALPLKIGSKAEYTRQWKAMIGGEIKNIRRLQALTIETATIIDELHSASQIQISKAWSPLDGNASNYQKYLTEITSQIRELTRVFNDAEDMIKNATQTMELKKGESGKTRLQCAPTWPELLFFTLRASAQQLSMTLMKTKPKPKDHFWN